MQTTFFKTQVSTGDFRQGFGKEPLGPENYGNYDETYDYEAAPSAFDVYMATKTLADKHIWKLQKENPDVDITICQWPPYPSRSHC